MADSNIVTRNQNWVTTILLIWTPNFFTYLGKKTLFLCKDGFPLDVFSYEKWKTSLTTSFPGPFVAFKFLDFTRHLATLHSHIRRETKHPKKYIHNKCYFLVNLSFFHLFYEQDCRMVLKTAFKLYHYLHGTFLFLFYLLDTLAISSCHLGS